MSGRDEMELVGEETEEDSQVVLWADTPAFKECIVLKHQIERKVGLAPQGAALLIKEFRYRNETYFQLVCWCETGNAKAMEYVLKCQSAMPSN